MKQLRNLVKTTLLAFTITLVTHAKAIDLLQFYPTTLTKGDLDPYDARPWQFTNTDIFRLSEFALSVGDALSVQTGPADVGIGHCPDGAVWAVIIPRSSGTLTSQVTNITEGIRTVWLRFHPSVITNLFPSETVFADGDQSLYAEMDIIATAKVRSSYQSGGNVMIPEPNNLTVDIDTQDGPRRFFSVDTVAGTADYFSSFEDYSIPEPPAITFDLAQSAFDQLWAAFDQTYAMFVIRPEVDWNALRDQYRPLALASKTTYEFAGVCADMLQALRDLHVWLTVGGTSVPVFDRPRPANANPAADGSILGRVDSAGAQIDWAITTNQIGFIAIYGWTDSSVASEFDQVLLQMRATRGLIIDVRLNGGGSEDVASLVAGRFLDQQFIYAYDQIRNGPNHTDLTPKIPRQTGPGGQWRYDRPVVLLIGQKCISSSESFVGMMTGAPQVTTMGDHTAGSSGNPMIIQLPLNMSVSVPQWIDYLPDGTLLDERGFAPQVPFAGALGSFQGTRDDLLSAALDRLKAVPLPVQPIQVSGVISAGQWPGYDRGDPKAITVEGQYAYVGAGALQVLDVSDPTQPKRMAAWATGSNVSDVALAGHYAYVADYYAGLSVLDITDLVNPTKLGQLASVGLSALAVFGGNAYLVFNNQKLEVVDISNPQHPWVAGTYATNLSCAAIAGNYAYIGEGNTGLGILDITNPQQLQRVGGCATSNSVRSIAVSGNYAYAAAGSAGLLVIDVTDPVDPRQVGAWSSSGVSSTSKVAISGQYLLALDFSSRLFILDITAPANPRLLGQLTTSSPPTAMALCGTNVYVADSAGIEVFSIADLTQPQRIGYCQVAGNAQEVALAGDYACVADSQGGLQVIGVADPASPHWITSFNFGGHANVRSVATTGNCACVADYNTGLHVMDLVAPGGPREVGNLALFGASEVVTSLTNAYLVDVNPTLHVIDLSDPANPKRVGGYPLPSAYPVKLAVGGNHLFAWSSGFGLSVIDISTPAQAWTVGLYHTNWNMVSSMAVAGNYLYVGDLLEGLQIFDVSQPGHPQWVGSYSRYSNTGLFARGIVVSGRLAYMIESTGLDLLNVTDPTQPQLMSWASQSGGYGLAVNGNSICVAAGASGLLVFQRIPAAPRFESSPFFIGTDCWLSFTGDPGGSVLFQRSTDLAHWEDWQTVIPDGTTQQVVDTSALFRPVQFYRAILK